MLWEGHNWAGTQTHGEEVQGRGSFIWKHPRQEADVPAAGWAVGLVGSCSNSDPKTHASPLTPLSPFHSALLPASPTPFPSSYSFYLFNLPFAVFPTIPYTGPSPFLTSCLSLTHSISISLHVWTLWCRVAPPGRTANLAVSGSFFSGQNQGVKTQAKYAQGERKKKGILSKIHFIFIFLPLIDGREKRR